jgi:hypothetical protein
MKTVPTKEKGSTPLHATTYHQVGDSERKHQVTYDEKVDALVNYGGYTIAEAIFFLQDMGDDQDD